MGTGVYLYSKVTERGTELQCPYSVSHLLNLCFTHLAAHLFLSYKASSEKKVIDTTPFSPKRHVFSFQRRMKLYCSPLFSAALHIQTYTVPESKTFCPWAPENTQHSSFFLFFILREWVRDLCLRSLTAKTRNNQEWEVLEELANIF